MDRKLLLFDVDGILVFNEKIKSQDKPAIIDFQKKHLFGVCSSRPLCGLDALYGIGDSYNDLPLFEACDYASVDSINEAINQVLK